jgi:hypothetical protein
MKMILCVLIYCLGVVLTLVLGIKGQVENELFTEEDAGIYLLISCFWPISLLVYATLIIIPRFLKRIVVKIASLFKEKK